MNKWLMLFNHDKPHRLVASHLLGFVSAYFPAGQSLLPGPLEKVARFSNECAQHKTHNRCICLVFVFLFEMKSRP